MTSLVTETLHDAIARTIGQESSAVSALRNYNEIMRDRDPAKVAWPAALVLELALRHHSPCELKEYYGYTDEEWDALRCNPTFLKELGDACEQVKQDGASFKIKARFQAEEYLNTSWKLVHAPSSEVPAAVKAKLMEATWRMAGFDNKDGVIGANNMLAIQINLGG